MSGAIFDGTLDNRVFTKVFFAKTFLSKCFKTVFLCKKSLLRLESWNSEHALCFLPFFKMLTGSCLESTVYNKIFS